MFQVCGFFIWYLSIGLITTSLPGGRPEGLPHPHAGTVEHGHAAGRVHRAGHPRGAAERDRHRRRAAHEGALLVRDRQLLDDGADRRERVPAGSVHLVDRRRSP